jgi:hypothetical protein
MITLTVQQSVATFEDTNRIAIEAAEEERRRRDENNERLRRLRLAKETDLSIQPSTRPKPGVARGDVDETAMERKILDRVP